MKVPIGLALSTFILYCTFLQSRGVIIEGPETVIYFPGQGPIELICNASQGTILWMVNDSRYSLTQLRNGDLPDHSATDGNETNIIINVPMNNTKYVCVSSTNNNDVLSDPAFVYIAAVPERVPDFTGMASSTTLEGNMYNLTLSWGEPFNNFDPIMNYTVSCSGDVTCPPNYTTADNITRSHNVSNLNATIVYNFTVVATNSLGSGEPAMFLTAPLTVPDQVTGVNLTCELSQSELYYYCTAKWMPVTIGNGPLEQPLMYRVYYTGYFEYVNSTTTYLVFRAPPVPAGYFVSNITVGVTAINRFGAGPPSENVSVEVMAPSVTKVIATSLTDMPSDTYNYTLNCTIAPESTADTCEVMLKSGGISKMGSSPVTNGSAKIKFLGLNCLDLYTIIAGGTLNGVLVGPRSSHGNFTPGECVMPIIPTSTMIVTVPSTSVTTPRPTETGAAVGTTCSIILVALTTLITMVM